MQDVGMAGFADVFIVPDVADPGRRIQYKAAVAGSIVLSQCLITKDIGGYVRYKRACSVHKEMWLSDRFKEKHAEIETILQEA